MPDQKNTEKRSSSRENRSDLLSRRNFFKGVGAALGFALTKRFPLGIDHVTAQSLTQSEVIENTPHQEATQRCLELSRLIIDSQKDQASLDTAKQKLLKMLPIFLKNGQSFDLMISSEDPHKDYQSFQIRPSSLQPGDWIISFGPDTSALAEVFQNITTDPGSGSSTRSISLQNLITVLGDTEQSLQMAFATDFANVGTTIRVTLDYRMSLVRGEVADMYRDQIAPLLKSDEFFQDAFNDEGSLRGAIGEKAKGTNSDGSDLVDPYYSVSQIQSTSYLVRLSTLGETKYSTNLFFSYANSSGSPSLKLLGDQDGMHFEYVTAQSSLGNEFDSGPDVSFKHESPQESNKQASQSMPDDFYTSIRLHGMAMSLLLSSYSAPKGEII